ncbi:MAG: permease-like cell division protein FtsX [Clostridiales bacterium]|uniref:permease-like cell division protein FtsX n=1 Tax=Hornefia butyriciproducens TaxID=2652293 RepID=UPI0029F917D2|nr:permease-like cell division protein FtsX [Hornefia butyriciproducens]MCI7679777.1 permease-like cell division protein FtsX [Clostridiales bacterium]MDD7019150.1 permease-like cell division protein FtsX [Hornefia butyriciproducens]MDY5462355.1 permease-like cell division protein FtsX [Hornefia butyriciproducens]
MIRLFYNIKQAILQIGRNKGMALASIFAITAMMLILGMFFVIVVNVNLFTEMVKQDYDTVEVYLMDSTDTKQAQTIMDTLENINGVNKVQYRTKAQALEILKERWGESGYLLDSLGDNPLPNSVLVKVDNLSAANRVNSAAGKIAGVESTKYYKETVDKLTRVTNFMAIAAMVIMLFLIIVSIVVVANTIRLTVFARAREISIMKYVGATNWFVRGPFLVEGIIIGAVSSLIAAGVTYLFYGRIVDAIGVKVMTILSSPLVPAGYLASNLVIIFLALGVGIGSTGSIISMRKFLDK